MGVTFSASMLECFNSCRRYYFYKYVERIDVKNNPYIALGIILHKMFERFYKLNYHNKKSFQKQYSYEWMSACAENSSLVKGIWVYNESERKEILKNFFWSGWHILDKFYTKHREKRDELEEKIKELKKEITEKYEDAFLKQTSLIRTTKKSLKKTTKSLINEEFAVRRKELFPRIEERINFELNGFQLNAKLDRIDIKDGNFYVTDYKTGKKREESFNNHQPVIYYYAIFHKFGKFPEAIIKSYVKSGEDVLVIIGEEHLYYLIEDLKAADFFMNDVKKASNIIKKNKVDQKSNKLTLPIFNQEITLANQILDIKRFKPRKEGQCYFCDYHFSCDDQLRNRQKELKNIWNAKNLEETIENLWNEIDFE